MTEKRFKYKITDGFFDGDVLISIKEVVGLLNEQQATIEQLKSELNDCEKFRYQVFKRIGELSDE